METLTITAPDDFHFHPREDPILKFLLQLHAKSFKRGLVMPNTDTPIFGATEASIYKGMIDNHKTGFEPLMSIYLTMDTTVKMIIDAVKAGVIAGKLYTKGATTNSKYGVPMGMFMEKMRHIFEAMEKYGMVLCLHGEDPNAYFLEGESKFLTTLGYIHNACPDLRIVLEHVSSKAGVDYVKSLSKKVAATITLHHMMLTTDDILKGKLRPDNFCMPPAKRPADRDAVLAAALSGNSKFFLGTDSAAHDQSAKYCCEGCAGILSSEVVMPKLVEIFENAGKIKWLQNFTSIFGAQYYGVPINKEKITLIKQPMIVTEFYEFNLPDNTTRRYTPFLAKQVIPWQIQKK